MHPVVNKRALATMLLIAATQLASCDPSNGGKIDIRIAIAVPTSPAAVRPGGSGTIHIVATRTNFDRGIEMTAVSPPTTVTIPNVELDGNATEIDMPFTISPSATAGTISLQLKGEENADPGEDSPVITVPITVLTPGSFALSVTPTGPVIYPGGHSDETINISRDHLDGDIAITTDAPAAGITLSGATQTISGATGALSIAVDQFMAPGSYPIVVHATSGITVQTFTVTVQVATFSLGGTPPSSGITPGTSDDGSIHVTRDPGFTAPVTVAYTVTPVNAGITFSQDPNPVVGTAADVTINVASNVSPGTYHVTATGTAANQPSRITTFDVVVTAQSNVALAFCPVSGLPLWVAVRDGDNGSWVHVTGANNIYNLTVTQGRGTIAYVTSGQGGTHLYVLTANTGELQSFGGQLCNTGSGALTTAVGSVTNVGTAHQVITSAGTATGIVTLPSTVFTLGNVPPGAHDLVAASVDGQTPPSPIRMLLRRNQTIAGTIAPLDFTAEGFAPTQATLTFNLIDQGISAVFQLHTLRDPLATYYTAFANSANAFPLFGLPVAQQAPGDLHYISAQTFHGTGSTTAYRIAGTAMSNIVNTQLQFGGAMVVPNITVLGVTSNAQLRATWPFQSEYTQLSTVFYDQSSPTDHQVTVQSTLALGDNLATQLDIPDFSPVAGWNPSWGISHGVALMWSATAATWDNAGGGVLFPLLVEGTRFKSATAQGSFTP